MVTYSLPVRLVEYLQVSRPFPSTEAVDPTSDYLGSLLGTLLRGFFSFVFPPKVPSPSIRTSV